MLYAWLTGIAGLGTLGSGARLREEGRRKERKLGQFGGLAVLGRAFGGLGGSLWGEWIRWVTGFLPKREKRGD